MTSAAIVIPARLASTRLPGKPLLRETGQYLVEHVYEAARAASGFDTVIVATDDERIAEAVRSFGGEVRMTPADCPSGTDRVALIARDLHVQIVVNLQGDEPEMQPDALSALVVALENDPRATIATLATRLVDREEFLDPNVVKVVVSQDGRALYFSRAPIPHPRHGSEVPKIALKHLGVYAYRQDSLQELSAAPPGAHETTEGLEQLRFLDLGHSIQVVEVPFDSNGIDTPEEYARFVARHLDQS